MGNISAYIFRCPKCGAKNRIPEEKIKLTAKCGRCKTPFDTAELMIATPVIVIDRDFDSKVLKAPLPVLLDCWAPWCGACQILGPVIDELAAEWKGRVRVGKLNVDDNPIIASKFRIRSVPTMLVFDKGQWVETLTGAVPKHQIKSKMASYMELR